MCSDVPTEFATAMDSCTSNIEVCTTLDGETTSSVCSNTIWPPQSAGQYRLGLNYLNSDCSGDYTSVLGDLVDTCVQIGLSSLYRKYTCSDGKVNTVTCSDSACSTGCTTVSVDQGACDTIGVLSVKYECSSGFQTAAFASVTAVLAAVASAVSFF